MECRPIASDRFPLGIEEGKRVFVKSRVAQKDLKESVFKDKPL